MASQTTGVSIVYSSVCSGVDERKHQSSASLAFVRGTHLPVNSSHKEPATRKMLPFDDVIVWCVSLVRRWIQVRGWHVPQLSSHPGSLCNVMEDWFRHHEPLYIPQRSTSLRRLLFCVRCGWYNADVFFTNPLGCSLRTAGTRWPWHS